MAGPLYKAFIKPRSIFYFTTNKIDSPEPHNSIIIYISPVLNLSFSLCTTKDQTIKRYIQRSGAHVDTMVELDYGKYSFLKQPTFINCNSLVPYTDNEFEKKHDRGHVTYRAKLDKDEFNAIVRGIKLSNDIDEEIKSALAEI